MASSDSVDPRIAPDMLARLEAAARRRPREVAAQLSYARALGAAGDWPRAAAVLGAALRHRPAEAALWLEHGNALVSAERLEEAEASYRRARALQPRELAPLANLAGCLARQGRREAAIALLDEALTLAPGQARLHYNRALLQAELGEDALAVEGLRAALQRDPSMIAAYINLGNALTRLGRIEEARAAFDRAVALAPRHDELRYNRAMLLLAQGDYAEGWRDYEARLRLKSIQRRPPPFTPWQGEPLAGRRLLVHAEQGLGDTLMMLRYLPLLAERGARLALEVQPALKKLVRSALAEGIEVVARDEPLPDCELSVSTMSLPWLLGTRLDTIPARIPYLAVEPARAARWRGWLADTAGPGTFTVGIAWQGNPNFRFDRNRSVALDRFRVLAGIAGVRLVSLQKGAGSEQLEAWEGGDRPLDPGPELDRDGAFLDTAALMQALDMVVVPSTALSHLAGALGRPLAVVLPAVTDWRWLIGRRDSPWYPSATLYRQPVAGDWDSVFAALARDLSTRRAGRHI